MCSPNFCAKQLDQAAAVPGFLLLHAFEDGGGRGELFPQTVGEVGVDALVFLFQRYRQRQDFAFGEAVEIAHT